MLGAVALSNMLLEPVLTEPAEREEQSYDRKLLVKLCAQLGPQDLAEVLKYPFCTSESDQIVLNQLQATTGRNFDGDLWKFVEQAESLGIKNIDNPATRPSVQDALRELDEAQVRSIVAGSQSSNRKRAGGKEAATKSENRIEFGHLPELWRWLDHAKPNSSLPKETTIILEQTFQQDGRSKIGC